MLYSLSDFQCQICTLFFLYCISLRYSAAPSWDVWMVVVFKEAETFKSVAAVSLSSEYCPLSWAGEKKEVTPLVITESTEPANGSDYSNLFHGTESIELDSS